MSARIVAVTSLLADVLTDLATHDKLTPSEADLAALLLPDIDALQRINATARAEMQALAPMVLAGESAGW